MSNDKNLFRIEKRGGVTYFLFRPVRDLWRLNCGSQKNVLLAVLGACRGFKGSCYYSNRKENEELISSFPMRIDYLPSLMVPLPQFHKPLYMFPSVKTGQADMRHGASRPGCFAHIRDMPTTSSPAWQSRQFI